MIIKISLVNLKYNGETLIDELIKRSAKSGTRVA